jgi:hypothetical protein
MWTPVLIESFLVGSTPDASLFAAYGSVAPSK